MSLSWHHIVVKCKTKIWRSCAMHTNSLFDYTTKKTLVLCLYGNRSWRSVRNKTRVKHTRVWRNESNWLSLRAGGNKHGTDSPSCTNKEWSTLRKNVRSCVQTVFFSSVCNLCGMRYFQNHKFSPNNTRCVVEWEVSDVCNDSTTFVIRVKQWTVWPWWWRQYDPSKYG